MIADLRSFWRLLPEDARRSLILLLLASVVAAALELATFAALATLLTALGKSQQAIGQWALLFAAAALGSAILRLWLNTRTIRLSNEVAHRLAVDSQRRLLDQPLEFHVRFNSAKAVALVDKAVQLTAGTLLPLVHLVQSVLVGSVLCAALVWTSPLAALAVAACLGTAYALASVWSWRQIRSAGRSLSEGYNRRTQTILESFGGIRDVILDGLQQQRLALFARTDRALQSGQTSIQSLVAVPRYLIEGAAMAAAALLLWWLSAKGLGTLVPTLGLLGYAGMRLLPLANQAYGGWQGWRANHAIVDDFRAVFDLPDRPQRSSHDITFERSVAVEGVAFAYEGGPPVLSDVTLSIRRGEKVGLAGLTGSGKSTLADLFMGLISPGTGALLVDGQPVTAHNAQDWQRCLSHVGQHVFLLDASVAQNVALGDPEPDRARIVTALRRACLEEFEMRMDEAVGESGVRLSGGQRQRIGIARAFYKGRPLLVLDEATSALDPETERRVLANIPGEATVLLISHRTAPLEYCDRRFDMVAGTPVERGA